MNPTNNPYSPPARAPSPLPKLSGAPALFELLGNFGGPGCTAHIEDGKVHDQTEFYESCCALLGLEKKTDVYIDVITIVNESAWLAEFIRGHKVELIHLGWLAS